MHISRIHHSERLTVGGQIALNGDAANYVSRILRMTTGQHLQLFDGSNRVFDAAITEAGERNVMVEVLSGKPGDHEPPLYIHLDQVMSRGEKMGFTTQKSTGLGVSLIVSLFSEHCGVKLDVKRLQKKIQQWQKIVIVACEQSGRNVVPRIRPAMQLEEWCTEQNSGMKFNLHPHASASISTLPLPVGRVRLLIGLEGGLSAEEIVMATQYQSTDVLLGPRVLRMETAALTVIIALQVRFGDLG